MAKRTVPKGDTSPPLRLSISDQEGLVDLTAAAGTITGYFQGHQGETLVGTIVGPIEPIAPPEDGLDENGEDVQFNARYVWQAGDTDVIADYRGQVRVEWDAGGTQVETFPSGKGGEAEFFEFSVVDNLVPAP